MRKEYRYKTNFLLKAFPFIWLVAILASFIYSMILFIPQGAINYILIDLVVIAFFGYVFRHLFRLYSLNVPLLVVDEHEIIVVTLYGTKTIPYDDIISINIRIGKITKSSTMTIESRSNSPINIVINNLNDSIKDIEAHIVGLYHNHKLTVQEVDEE